MFADHSALSFLGRHLPGTTLLPETRLVDILDSLTFLDFFLFLEQSLDGAVALDDVAQCATLGELVTLLDRAAAPQSQ